MGHSLIKRPRMSLALLVSAILMLAFLLLSPLGLLDRALAQHGVPEQDVDVRVLDLATGLDTKVVDSGDAFTMVVQVDAAVGKEIGAASIFLNFDPTVLNVVGEAAGVVVTIPTGWSQFGPTVADNELGIVDVSGLLDLFGTFPVDTVFELITIDFIAVEEAPIGSVIDFETVDAVRTTALGLTIDTVPTDVTGTLFPATITVSGDIPPNAVIDGPSVADEGSTVVFSGDASTPGGDGTFIATYTWDFGDGNVGLGNSSVTPTQTMMSTP